MRTLNRPRPPGDPGKVDELRRVSRDLVTAHRIFEHLHRQGRASGIHRHKPEEHVNYVADAFNKTQASAVCRAEAAGWLAERSMGLGQGQVVGPPVSISLIVCSRFDGSPGRQCNIPHPH